MDLLCRLGKTVKTLVCVVGLIDPSVRLLARSDLALVLPD